MDIYYASNFIRESSDKVYKHFLLTLPKSEKHYHEWPRVHVPEKVKLNSLMSWAKELMKSDYKRVHHPHARPLNMVKKV